MNALEELIRKQITQVGPMRVSDYMSLCLGHLEHGYYMARDPFGTEGDFTTAPEISQLFGEVLAAWVADVWVKLGSGRLHLVEFGPGRGTLMADLLRLLLSVEGVKDALSVHLVETSPHLKKRQEDALSEHNITWHESSDSLPEDAPLIVIGNEFLDALPVRQFLFHEGRWCEQMVVIQDDALVLAPIETRQAIAAPNARESDIYERNDTAHGIMRDIASRLHTQGGAGLFFDYGFKGPAFGDTLQAVKDHKYCGIFESPGEADLTAHVDFEPLITIARQEGLHSYPLLPQGKFLVNIGIEVRAYNVLAKANDVQEKNILEGLYRLTDPSQMGELFKVFCVSGKNLRCSGF